MSPRLAMPVLLALSLAACVAGPAPEIATPAPDLPDRFWHDPQTQGEGLDVLLPSGDPAFEALAAQALAQSPSLAAALARVEAARASAARAGAERLPQLGADASVTGVRTSPNQIGSNLPGGIALDTERVAYAANLTASWDTDLFGRIKAQARAADARLDAAEWEAHGVRVALLAEIAGSVIDWRSLTAREVALRQDLAAAEGLARLALSREEAGLAPGFDRVRAQAAASASNSRLAALENERARLVGRLVTLTALDGEAVASALAQPFAAGDVPSPARALPSSLLQNRPDVLAAMAQLQAADADLAAAARQRFPRLTLSAALGLLSFNLSSLFESDSLVGSLGAGLAAPLLDFGRIEAEIDGAAANKSAAFAAYRGAVFTALGDAEAAYGLVAASDIEAAAAMDENAQLERAASLADTRFRAGLADFLTVLEARRAADASGERAAAALGRARRARVLLWQALGGSPDQLTSRSISQ